jgi:hypothetical protein
MSGLVLGGRALFGMIAATGLIAFAGGALLAKTPVDQKSAWIGIAAATASGFLSLFLKRWALRRSLKAALMVVGVMFGIRLVLVALGIAFLTFRGANTVAFVFGFFSVYFVLQWLEIGYVSSAAKRRPAPLRGTNG